MALNSKALAPNRLPASRGAAPAGTSQLPAQLVPASARLIGTQGGVVKAATPRRGSKSPRLPVLAAVSTVQLDVPTVEIKPAQTATKALWFHASGQSANGMFGAPLVGRPEPFGASIDASSGAINYAVSAPGARGVTLVLFTEHDLAAGRSTVELQLEPQQNRTGDVWHIMLPNLREDLYYGYRVDGPHQDSDPIDAAGHRFNASKVILDPYARAVLSRRHYGELGPNLPYGQPGVLGLANTWPQFAGAVPSPRDHFDWEGDTPLNLPMSELVIYEAHVRGFTAHPSSGVDAPGTYAGFIERLDYLKSLGITAVELLPVHEFNELEYYAPIPGQPDKYRVNFWGYSTVNFFAPMSRYSAAVARGEPVRHASNELKQLVKECHRRGIEVILDVVFNHTAEGNDKGPTISFRGLDNRVYYMMAPGGEYYNYSGCGNTLNCNQPSVRRFILECLRYWVTEFHVDGFRFDLASILTRAHSAWHPQEYDEDDQPVAPLGPAGIVNNYGSMTDGAGVPTGTPLPDPPLVEMISEDPVLRNTKMIAEAWDCDGLNQVGAFPHYGGRWAEWNGQFRDTVRQFVKGTDGPWAGNFASAICGSPNIYANSAPHETDWWGNNGGRKWRGGRGPTASINFVTAHDGFTLADLVAYNEKHNDINGEGNRDGEQHNNSWNCGVEGQTDRFDVNRLRLRQMRNLMAALLVSHGVPMINMGDEYGHSKDGNNNTYCHDSELNWLRWDMAEQDPYGLRRFTRHMVALRRSHPELRRSTYVTDRDIQWHGELPQTPDWTEASRLVAFTVSDGKGGGLYIAFNTAHTPKLLTLPKQGGRVWQPLVDTAKTAPFDVLVPDSQLSADDVLAARLASSQWTLEGVYPVMPWSCVILESLPDVTAMSTKITRKADAAKPPPGTLWSVHGPASELWQGIGASHNGAGNGRPQAAAAQAKHAEPHQARPSVAPQQQQKQKQHVNERQHQAAVAASDDVRSKLRSHIEATVPDAAPRFESRFNLAAEKHAQEQHAHHQQQGQGHQHMAARSVAAEQLFNSGHAAAAPQQQQQPKPAAAAPPKPAAAPAVASGSASSKPLPSAVEIARRQREAAIAAATVLHKKLEQVAASSGNMSPEDRLALDKMMKENEDLRRKLGLIPPTK